MITIEEFIELLDKEYAATTLDVEKIEDAACYLFIGDHNHLLGQFRYDMARELEKKSGNKYKIKILERDSFGPLVAGVFCQGDKRWVHFG